MPYSLNMLNTSAYDFPVVVETSIGSNWRIYSAWEPSPRHEPSHSTITHDAQGRRWGRVGCRPLPAELDALQPYSQERSDRVSAWHAAQYEEAYSLIVPCLPDGWTWRASMGEISVTR